MDNELKLKDNVVLRFPEGVTQYKFSPLLALAVNPEEVEKTFLAHGYNLSELAGSFAKAFTINALELREIRNNLDKIDQMGLKDIFNKNLRLCYFRNKFMNNLEVCLANDIPYLNDDNSFANYLVNDEEFNKVVSEKKKTSQSVKRERQAVSEEFELSIEDKQVYNEIVQRLNYLILANPMDAALADVVKNATKKVVEPIARGEYKFLSIAEIVLSVMFSGMEIASEDSRRIQDLVSGAFNDEERKLVQ